MEPPSAPMSPAIRSLVDWLIDGARSVRRPQDVLAELCRRLTEAGLPLYRVAVLVRTLHPNVIGRRFVWRPGTEVEISEGRYETLTTDTYRRSPVVPVFQIGQTIRRRLEDPACPDDYNILAELRAEGVTDYLIQPLPFTSGEIHAVSWTTRRRGGFAPSDLAALEAVHLPLARIAEAYALRRVATTLLDTYVGRGAG